MTSTISGAGITTGTEALTGLQDLSNASAGQIKFPSTQNPSADPHTLDDYSEGTWTPNQGAGLTVVGAFSSGGIYTKVGRLVTCTGYVAGATSVALAAAGIVCSNLPFTVLTLGCAGAAVNGSINASIVVFANAGTTQLNAVGAMTASGQISFTVTYFV